LGSINKTKPLDIYKEDFETPFLANTRDYYARESSLFISANGVSAYMKKAEERLEEEHNRAKKFLDSSTHEKVHLQLEYDLCTAHLLFAVKEGM
jgi:NAD dependent epimerase/dehydratase family enzyme